MHTHQSTIGGEMRLQSLLKQRFVDESSDIVEVPTNITTAYADQKRLNHKHSL